MNERCPFLDDVPPHAPAAASRLLLRGPSLRVMFSRSLPTTAATVAIVPTGVLVACRDAVCLTGAC